MSLQIELSTPIKDARWFRRYVQLVSYITLLILPCCVNPTDNMRPAREDYSAKEPTPLPRSAQSTPHTQATRRTNDSETIKKDSETIEKSLPPLELTFVGDVMFGRYSENGLGRNPEEGAPVFDAVRPLISADIAVANLETSLLRKPPAKCPWPPALRFTAGPQAISALKEAGFTAVSLANNHVYDMRHDGVLDSLEMLREQGIVPVGPPAAQGASPFGFTSITAKGSRVALIGITSWRNSLPSAGTPPLPYIPLAQNVPIILEPVIREARLSHDLVVVLVHWGVADTDNPERRRVAASRRLIDLGADLVISHHPHVLQGVERYGNGLIAHSLGDFLFDKIRDPNRLTGVLRIRYEKRSRIPAQVRFHPVVLVKRQASIYPIPAEGALAAAVKRRLEELSKPLGTTWQEAGAGLVLKERASVIPPQASE